MVRSVDDFINDTEHDAIDHTGSPFNLLDSSGHSAINHKDLPGVGKVLQRLYFSDTTQRTVGMAVPVDNTAPTTGETQTCFGSNPQITPISANSAIIAMAAATFGVHTNAVRHGAFGFWLNGASTARRLTQFHMGDIFTPHSATVFDYYQAGNTSTQTWAVRFGGGSDFVGTLGVNPTLWATRLAVHCILMEVES